MHNIGHIPLQGEPIIAFTNPTQEHSSHQEELSTKSEGSVRCQNHVRTTTRNESASSMYKQCDILIAYIHCNESVNNKKEKTKMEKVSKSKGCWSSTKRKARRTKQYMKNKAKNVSSRAKKLYKDYIRIFLLIRSILILSAHIADVGTDGNTAYSHYNNEDLVIKDRMAYAYYTVFCMVWPMLAAFIMCTMEVIANKHWSIKRKCLMVAMFIGLAPANSSLILLWDVVTIYKSQNPSYHHRSPSAQKAGIMKLVEAVSESMPQTVLQLEIVSRLMHNDVSVPIAVWLGIATSIPSLALAVATNKVFGVTAAKVSRAVWLFGCVVGIPVRVAVIIMGCSLQAWRVMAATFCAMVIIRHVHGNRMKWPPSLPLHHDEDMTNVQVGTTVSYKWFILSSAYLFVVFGFITLGRMAYHYLELLLVVTIIALALIYCTVAIMKDIFGCKFKWTPWPDWPPLLEETNLASTAAGGTVCYNSNRRASVCLLSLFSVSLCTFDSCCSISSLPMTCVTLVMAICQYPFSYYLIPQSLAMSIVAMAIVSFIMNFLMVVIPKFNSVGKDWDNAWDNTVYRLIEWLKHHRPNIVKWIKQHRSKDPTSCNDNEDNGNINNSDNSIDGEDIRENENNYYGYDNNGYDINGDDDVHSANDDTDGNIDNVHYNYVHNVV